MSPKTSIFFHIVALILGSQYGVVGITAEESDSMGKESHQEILKIHIRHYEPPKCIVDGRLRYELVTIL